MSTTPFQPTLPPELDFTDAEVDFIENSPPGLFAENQDSNLGLFRKLFTDDIQELADQMDTLYQERFVQSSKLFLDEWELQEGVPPNPAGIDIATRQAIVLGRVRQGPFTRAGRRQVVENYIGATFGTPVALSPSGIVLSAAGTPLYSDVSSVAQAYEIVEDIPNFLYHVYIDNSLTPASGMARELSRITPAGISYDITYVTKPVATLYWKLNNPAGATVVADLSPYGHPSTSITGVTFGGKALSTDAQPSAFFGSSGARIISGYNPFTLNSQRTFMGWAYRNTSTDNDDLFIGGNVMAFLPGASTDFSFNNGGNQQTWAAAWPGNGQWVHWALTYNDSTKISELFINGTTKGTKTHTLAYASTGNFALGGLTTATFAGYMRDCVIYERVLSAAEILSYAHGFQLP